MPASNVILESHHVIENTVFRKHDLLIKLADHGLIDKDVSVNRLYLPVDGKLADGLKTSPHRGRTRRSYTDVTGDYLDNLLKSPDGRAAMRNDAAALKRVAAQVHDLQDTLKVALINRDMFATTPDHLTKAET
ncbi:AHH domain-containing protein, partial [Xanthomonas melonis]